MKINKVLILNIGCIAALFLASCSKSGSSVQPTKPFNPTGPPAIIDSGWSFESTPAFADEFNYTGTPDTSKWTYDLGGGGWGNHELEYYTKYLPNANVGNGVLHITALAQFIGGYNYSSSRLVSKNAGSLTYGRVEASVKFPPGVGTWPAVWMLPDKYVYGPWPASGEVDIVEQVGYDPLNVHFSVHNSENYGSNSHTETTNLQTDTSAFHDYRVDWTPYAIRGYYDNALIFTFVNPNTGSNQWPFDQSFHVLMNLAIGGSWGGIDGVQANLCPATMQVDYIRFYNMIHK